MSGKPSPDGVTELLVLLRRQRALQIEVAELMKVSARLKEASEKLAETSSFIRTAMEAMDLIPGNYGWEGRMMWMIAELERQAAAK